MFYSCDAPSETDRYPLFARIVNTIFTIFNDSDDETPKIPHLRAAVGGDNCVVMHFNDPKLLFKTNHSREYTLKVTDKELDLLLVTIEVAKKIASNQPTSGNKSDAKLMDRPNWILWSEELCAAEIKNKLEKIPYLLQKRMGHGSENCTRSYHSRLPLPRTLFV
jgi:hypothetical protein